MALKSVAPEGLKPCERTWTGVRILSDAAILDEQVLGVLWKVRDHEDTEGGCAIGLKGSRVFLRISEPSEVGTVELYVLCCNGERVVLRMGRVDGDLRGLDLRDDVEWSVVGADAEGWTAKAESQEATRTGP